MAIITDKISASSQGLMILIDKSLAGPAFLVPPLLESSLYEVSNSFRGPKLPIPPKKEIFKWLKKLGEYIGQNAEDLKKIIDKVMIPEKKKEQKDVLPPPQIISPPLPSPPLHKALIQLLKGEYKIPLEIPHFLALAGVGMILGFAFMLMSNIAQVSTFSKGDEASVFCKVVNKKRFAAIYLHLTDEESQLVDYIVNAPFAVVGDGIEPGVVLHNWLSTATTKPFIMCSSSENMFSVAFRGQETCLVGGALIDDFISPIILGQGNFLIENIKFVVIASSGLLDVLGYQEIVDCVSLTKDHGNAQNIAKTALVRNPDMVELHVAVIFLT